MARYSAVCKHVEDGDTFRTTTETWIRLARYDAPEKGQPGYDEAKRLLSSLTLNNAIEYEAISISSERTVAEVWQSGKNINNIMLSSGYKK